MAGILAPRPRARRRRGDGLPVGHRRRPRRARQGRAAPARRRPRAGRARGRARRLRGGRHPLRPRGDDVGGGAGEAPARPLGAAARGVQRAQPRARCSSSSAATGPSTARSAPTTASRTCSMREGHIDAMCRQAVAQGIAPEDVLVMATLHPARCHGLADLGAIAPGYRADLVVLEDLDVVPRRGRDRGRRASPRATASRCRSPRPRCPTGCATPCTSRRSRPTRSTSARRASACA